MTKKTKVIFSSVASIAMCASLAVGGTYALFTSESEVNIAVTSGKVKMNALVDTDSVVMSSLGETMNGTWANGGVADVEAGEVVLSNMTPGDKISFNIDITNESTVNVQYRTVVSCVEGLDLFSGLVVTLDYANDVQQAQQFDGMTAYGSWTMLAPSVEDVDTVTVTIELPNRSEGLVFGADNLDNQYQGLGTKLNYRVEAVQGNAGMQDAEQDENTTLAYTANDMELIARQVNKGNTFAGETIEMMSDIDLAGATTFNARAGLESNWTPMGTKDNPFKGNFDGNDYAFKNLVLIEEGKSNIGLFGYTENGEIKNVTVENATIVGRLNVGVVAGTPYTSNYSNITVKGDVTVNGMAYVGGVFGKNVYGNITNVTVNVNEGSYVNANSVENGTAYRTYVGGVMGFMGEGGHTVSNVTSNIDVIGSTCDVGGITGIAHYGNTFKNCVATGNVTITSATEAADAEEMGGIAGVWHNETGNTVTLTDCVFEGELSANITEGVDLSDNTFVGAAYSKTGEGTLSIKNYYFVDGVQYVKNGVTGEVGLYDAAGFTGETLVVAEGTTYIGGSSFTYCGANVKKVILPSTLRKVNANAFKNSPVEEIVLNEGLTYVGDRAFSQAYSLKKINFPSTLTSVGTQAFRNTGFETMTIPATVTEIAERAFSDMKQCATIIVEGNPVIANFAFRSCAALTEIKFLGNNVVFTGTSQLFCRSDDAKNMDKITAYVANAEIAARLDKAQRGGGAIGYQLVVADTANENGVYGEGENTYAYATNDTELKAAIENGAKTIYLGSGVYVIPNAAQRKTLKFVGNGSTVIATKSDGSYEGCNYALDGSTATFENITINTTSTIYVGYARLNATYNNCTINGTYTLYDNSEFNGCTFNVSGNVYNLWTWGAPVATFNGCTFNSDGKALLLYGQANTQLTLNNCEFNDNGGLTDLKAAIEIGNDYNTSYNVVVNNTVVNGYEINDTGINTGSTLWGNKNSMSQEKLNVVVDGVDVY